MVFLYIKKTCLCEIGFKHKKTGTVVISENISGDLTFTDLTSNQL